MIVDANAPFSCSEDIRQQVCEALAAGRIAAVRGALRALRSLPIEMQGQPFRLGIVRTFTIETQVDVLALAISALPCQVEIKIADLENIEQELLNPESDLLQWQPDAVLVLWRLEELLPTLAFAPGTLTQEEREAGIEALVARIENLASGTLEVSNAPLLLSTLPLPQTGDLHDLHDGSGRRYAVERANARLMDCASKNSRISIFDFAGWSAKVGAAAFDRKMELYARQPIAPSAIGDFSLFLARTLRPFLSPPAKVLALDLDNVLWGGVLGEDGITGVKIGHDFPGNVYRRIQQRALELKACGVLLVLVSKNDREDVDKAFDALSDMSLTLGDFSEIRVNWEEKHRNVADIAKSLNVGLDSFVFVDDQAFEREQMQFHLPQVAILQVCEDPLTILNALETSWLFDRLRITREDLARSSDYQSQSQRKELERSSGSTEAFLRTLELRARLAPIEEQGIGRALQMLGKTNQFNVTTRRHTEAQLRALLDNPQNILLTLALADRFGDQGVIGLIIAVAEGRERLHVDSLLFSCRAIGRGAEEVLWSALIQEASIRGFGSLTAEYLRTPKNNQVADLFDRLGMERVGGDQNRTEYRLTLPHRALSPEWIEIIDKNKNGQLRKTVSRDSVRLQRGPGFHR